MPRIDIVGEDMPSIQRLAVRGADIKGRDLGFGEAELFRVVEVMVESCVDFVGVEGTSNTDISLQYIPDILIGEADGGRGFGVGRHVQSLEIGG